MRSPAICLVSLIVALLGATTCAMPGDQAQRDQAARAPPERSDSLPMRGSQLDELVAAGESIYWRGQYDSAGAVWQIALQQARTRGDSAAEARVLTWLGLAAWRRGEYGDARRHGEQALALKLRHGLRAELSRSYNALGLLAWNQGRLGEAATLFGKALERARAVNDMEGVAKASGNLALVHTELGEFEAARAGFTAMRDAGRALGDARIEGNALTNLGMLDWRVGDPRSAIDLLSEARRLYKAIDYRTGEQNALGQLGTAYASLGEPRLAFAVLDSALELARKQELKQEVASNLELIGGLHREAGDLRQALRFYGQARAIHDSLGLAVEQGTTRRNEAEVQAQLGHLDLARERAGEALRIHRTAKARFEELHDLVLLAELSQMARRPADASAHLDVAERLARQLDARIARAVVALARARAADRAGASREVLRVLHAARADLTRADYRTDWESNTLRARAYARLDRLDSAAAFGRLAIAAVERVRANYGSGVLRTSYVADKSATYSDLVGVLLRLGRVEEAFEVADAARGRALIEHLPTRGHGWQAASTVRALAQREVLLREIDGLTARLSDVEQTPPDDRDNAVEANAKQIAARLAAARTEYEAQLTRHGAGNDFSGPAALLGTTRVSAAEVRTALRPDEALLEYFVTPDRVLLFVLTPTRTTVLETKISSDDLAARVRLARELLARRETAAQSHTVLTALHRILIQPAARAGAVDGVSLLIVVPHSVLSYLPFAALRDDAADRFLVERYALVHLPSAAALPAQRSTARAGKVDRETAGRGSVFAPFPQVLPATTTEAEAVRRVVPRSTMYTAGRATERSLRRALSDGAVVHVATHAVMNVRNPMFSRVELARGSSGGPDDDGRLEVHELLGMTVTSRLVVLSGCETGVGAAWSTQFDRGEDYATLAQAFLYAGARSVVATLWRVEDEGAAVFAERFYRHLRQLTPAVALARAQTEMMRDSRYTAPFYWAAYQLSGDGGPGLFAREGASARLTSFRR